jgi:hypothetical protein
MSTIDVTRVLIRQGDVLLASTTLPVDLEPAPLTIVADPYSPHAHRIADSTAATVFAAPPEYGPRAALLVRVHEATLLVHEEHDPLEIPPGDYVVIRQRAFNDDGTFDLLEGD